MAVPVQRVVAKVERIDMYGGLRSNLDLLNRPYQQARSCVGTAQGNQRELARQKNMKKSQEISKGKRKKDSLTTSQGKQRDSEIMQQKQKAANEKSMQTREK
ncbi:small EDRK-rich factor 1-like [Zalophus californianus]|uniref:Small EDRK-rich factor 1-like n=1 Tax=Zalophus californianus TaxID=9704 RepID=A0A6P9FC89_ZALCA|nr:small EDRK-rich factor 1-like [Zalophus californianus]